MKKKFHNVILLTACINPNGMAYTVLQDCQVRRDQYISSIKFYLEETTSEIVFVENSNFDIRPYLNDFEISNRIEFITFDGNNFDKSKGKGYGEALILKEALRISRIIDKADTITKISGRYIVNDIGRLLSEIDNIDCAYMNYSRINGRYLCDSRFFAAPKNFYSDYFLKKIDIINDSEGYYFEHALFDSMGEWKMELPCSEFKSPFLFNGVTGSTGMAIRKTSFPYLKSYLKFYIHKLGYVENRKIKSV